MDSNDHRSDHVNYNISRTLKELSLSCNSYIFSVISPVNKKMCWSITV